MAVNTNTIVSNVYAQNYTPGSKEKTKVARNTETGEVKKEEKVTESKDLGKTIGDPKLSKEAQKYYEKLKKKYGNYDFILVSKDQKANAQANAAKYANNIKTVVLIDEEKIERMATDESYRKKYEGILSGATAQLQQLKSSVEKSGADVKEYGMQVNDGGTTSFFAVLRKSSSDQKSRIQKSAEKKKAEKKAAEKKAAQKKAEKAKDQTLAEKKAAEKKADEKRAEESKNEETTIADEKEYVQITAGSMEELINKVSSYAYDNSERNVLTESEKNVGQKFDFRG